MIHRTLFGALLLCLLNASPLLCAQENAEASAAEPAVVAAKEPAADKFTFRLKNGKEFSGFLDEKASVTMLVADTKVDIPLYKIQQLKFDINRPGAATVQLRDRDSISSQLVPAVIELVAEWGTISLNTDSISSMQLKP
jgi:hypothetical protein